MKKAETILNNLNEQNILTKKSYTYYEYVDQLVKFQKFVTTAVFGNNHHPALRIDEAIHELRINGIQQNLIDNTVFTIGCESLNKVKKELAISMSGKKGEDHINKLLSNKVTRNDFSNYRGIYLDNGIDNTEIDNIILTKNGFILLEVKNIKEDIKITEEGRLIIGRGASYEEKTLGEKMTRKRTLFKELMKKSLKEKGFNVDIMIESYVVFNEPYKTNIRINDLYKQEKWCKGYQLSNIVNEFELSNNYSEDEMYILKQCLQEFEVNQKQFITDLDFAKIKEDTANLLVLLDLPKVQSEVKLNRLSTLHRKRGKLSFIPIPLFGNGIMQLASMSAIVLTSTALLKNK